MAAEQLVGGMDLARFLRILRRRWLMIVAVTAVVTAAAFGAAMRKEPVYQASAEVLLRPSLAQSLLAPVAGSAQLDISNELAVMRSDAVQQTVVDEFGAPIPASVAAKDGTDIIVVSVQGPDPQEAARQANAYAELYIDIRRRIAVDELLATSDEIMSRIDEISERLAAPPASFGAAPADTMSEGERARLEAQRISYQSQLDQVRLASDLGRSGGAQLINAARVPAAPIGTGPTRAAALAGLLALLGTIGGAVLLELLDTRIRSKEQLEDATDGLTVIGLIPQLPAKRGSNGDTIDFSADSGSGAEAYRSLRTAVQFMSLERELRVIQCTSPTSSDGKTTTVANLGKAIAHAGKRVVLLDADLRRPRLHTIFGLRADRGLTNLLLGETDLATALQPVPGTPNLYVLGTGPLPPNPSELLGSRAAVDIVRRIAGSVDYLLIDSAPVLPVADAQIVSRMADGVVLVAAADRTTTREIARSCELLRHANASILGTVLNGVGASEAYGYGSRYQQYHRRRHDVPAGDGAALRAVAD